MEMGDGATIQHIWTGVGLDVAPEAKGPEWGSREWEPKQ